MAESVSRDNYGNKEEEDCDSSQQSTNQPASSNSEKYEDPAILSCGSAQERIQYDRELLLQLRNTPLSRKRPEYVLEGLSLRKLWCRTSDLMAGGDERPGGRTTGNSSHDYRTSANGTSTAASTYLMPMFAVKRRPNETKSIRKPDGSETPSSTTTTTNTSSAPLRRSVFMSGPQLTSVGGSSVLDRRIGSGRIPARDTPWEFRTEKEAIDQDFSFRPTGGLINIRERERERNLSSESQQKLQQQHRAGQLDRERDRDYRDDRYDKRTTYSRDYDRDKDRSSRLIGNSNNNLSSGNMRFSGGSHNNERRRMFSENRTEEPEWFSGGPTSQNDTIELRGFDEPEPEEQASRTTDTTAENDDQASLDNRSDNSNNNAEDCDAGAEAESDVVEDTTSTANTQDEQNDTNNNDNLNVNKGFMDPTNNSTEDFNFEDFLKMGLMTDLCQTDEEFKDNAVGESRFYRWFQRQSPPKENKSRRSSSQDILNESNQNNASARPGEKYFAPISPAASTGSSNSLLEFIQLGKFEKPSKEDPNLAGAGRGTMQSNSIPNNVTPSVCSVEELEARMRTSGGKSQNEVRNQQHQQDMQAFKKLLSQISGNDAGHMHREQQQQAMGPATGLMQMLSKNVQPPPFMLNNQRPQNLQPPIQRQPQIDAMQNVIQIGQHLQQSRDEILKRPEAQMLIQSICNAEVTQNSLMQQLNNPTSGARQRETIFAVLNFISECAPRMPSPIMMSSVMQSQSAVPMLHGTGVPLPKPPPTIQTNAPPNAGLNEQPNDVMQPHLLYQHHHQAAAAAAQKQLRVSPLPNGIPQRIPSPRELQFHTQSIMQSALIKKKLEEQRENFRKRQQQTQLNHGNQSQNQSEAGNLLPHSSMPLTQTSNSSPAKHHQHIASPTPLAFTPTSVLRKMTAEKDMDVISGVGIVGGNKDIIKSTLGQQIQQQIHQQQQQQQMRANQIKWNQFNQPPSKPMDVIPAGRPIVKGGGLPMQMASNVEFQQMRDQYLRKNNPQATLSNVMQSQQAAPQSQQLNLSQQHQMQQLQQLQHRQQQQQRTNNQIKWNQFNQPYQNQYQQMMHPHAMNQQQKPSATSGQSGNVLVNENHGMINFGREGALSPTSNQLARWFSPELLAQASAGKLPSLNIGQALSLEEFERSIQHSSATVHN